MSGIQALLTEYANGGSDWAFKELVSSYVNFVFSTALRIVGGDRPLAEDVTQAVFTDLARKAGSLPKDVHLGGWLHRHTCFLARKTLRRERRRIAREKQAMELHSAEDYTEANLAHLALVLDEVINDLAEEDRNAIVLRFFEQHDFRSIGAALGSSEDAARMRVSRAVDKIGRLLKRRGIFLSAAGICFVLSGKLATAAPIGLATRIVYVELARPARGQGIFQILREACFTRLNIGILGAAVLVALLALLMSGRHTGAKPLPNPDGKTFTPAEFADLAVQESNNANAPQTEVAPIKPESPPQATVAPAPQVARSVQTLTAKQAAVNVPRALPQQIVTQAPPRTESDLDTGSSSAPAVASMQANQNANALPGMYGPRRNTPQTSPPKAATNNTSLVVAKNPSNSITPTDPWSSTRTMATIDSGAPALAVPANQSAVQSARPAPQNLPPSLSGASRKRDGKP